jgi:predicted Zn-dependent protease
MKNRLVLSILFLTAAFWAGCYQVPVTGRSAVNLVDDKKVTEMSIAEFDQLKSRYPASRDKDKNAQLRRVGERIAKVVFWDMPLADWEFVVFDVPQQINAFAMAGGKVGIFTGLYKIVHNDDQLASVLAHEIAHVTAKHVHERLSQQLLVDTGQIAALVAGPGGIAGRVIYGAYGQTMGYTGLAFDRKKEKEADYIGLMYMARAGFNPEECARVLENLEQETAASGKPMPTALESSHPPTTERIQQINAAMPKALEAYRKSGYVTKPIVVK